MTGSAKVSELEPMVDNGGKKYGKEEKSMNATVMQNFLISLQIMGQGMIGIFLVVILIAIAVYLLGKYGKKG